MIPSQSTYDDVVFRRQGAAIYWMIGDTNKSSDQS